MKMHQKILLSIGTALILSPIWLVNGCATSQHTTVTPETNSNGVITDITNTTTVVNPVNLAIDASVAQGLTAGVVIVVLDKDASALPVIQDIDTGLSGVINGASTNSVSQILQAAGQKNAALETQITPLVQALSSLEQGLLNKYGVTVGGQISMAIAKAVDAGIKVGIASK